MTTTAPAVNPSYGTLDFTHEGAVRFAHRYHDRYGWTDFLANAAYVADDYAQLLGTEHAGTFLRACLSTGRALDIEQDDLRRAFGQVADEWWAAHRHEGLAATTYGAPWSPEHR